VSEDQEAPKQPEPDQTSRIAAKKALVKKRLARTQMLKGQTLGVEEIIVQRVPVTGLTSRLVTGPSSLAAGGNVTIADRDPTDALLEFDRDATDPFHVTDMDPTDPIGRPSDIIPVDPIVL
jgi:hypothetical protein